MCVYIGPYFCLAKTGSPDYTIASADYTTIADRSVANMSTTALTAPQTQRAWTVVSRGTPREVLLLDETAPVPSDLAAGEVLVKVEAAALNPVYVPRLPIRTNGIRLSAAVFTEGTN